MISKEIIKRAQNQNKSTETNEIESLLGKITLERIADYKDERYKIWKEMIEKEHYIENSHIFGKQIKYLIQSEKEGLIGALSFSSGAWRLNCRDEWIGWDKKNREKNLQRIICNSRFFIKERIRVSNLASHILSISIYRIKKDWQELYKTEPVLIETFVEQNRFNGTCYKAANFEKIGETRGRGRNDKNHNAELPIKDIYVYALKSNIRKELCAGQIDIKELEEKDWVSEEFKKIKLGDERLKNRLLTIVRDFYGKPEANIPQASQSRSKTKAAYRFFDNESVTMDTILSAHYESTKERIKKDKIILAVQDTTSLNYSAHPMTEDLGPIGSSKKTIGLLVHDTMAFNTEGTPLGLLNVQCWARDPENFGKKQKRFEAPIEEKESYKWIKSYQAAMSAQKENKKTIIVSVGDREADIYELFELALQDEKNPKVLVRANHNRNITEEQSHLWEYMESLEISGIQRIKVPRKSNIPSREADLSIRFHGIELKPPSRKKEKKKLKIHCVFAREENAPENVTPIEWMLLTTIPVNTFEEAIEKIEWYSKRWGIEIYHKTLKSGCKIEQRQLGNADRIESCLAIDMVIAWRIYHLTKLGREIPNVPCTVFFEEAEWKALIAYKTKNPIAPKKIPTLREAIHLVASLGGFLGRKCDGEPGTKTLWLGLQRLDDITETYKIFNTTSPP